MPIAIIALVIAIVIGVLGYALASNGKVAELSLKLYFAALLVFFFWLAGGVR